MKTLINFFKSIWNFFFGKKESTVTDYTVDYATGKILGKSTRPAKQPPFCPETEKALEEIFKPKKPQAQRFRKQQLLGKIYRLGKSRFRVIKKSAFTEPEKLRYEITQL